MQGSASDLDVDINEVPEQGHGQTPENPLRVILALERTGSFGRAAQYLGITQPGVSRALSRLETQYQSRLVERGGKGVRLTVAGQGLIAHARQLETTLRRAEESMRQIRGDRTGRISLGLSHGAIFQLLPRVIRRFRQLWPRVELQISTATHPAVLGQLRDGSVDLAVLSLADEVLPDFYEAIPLVAGALQVIAPYGHPLSKVRRLAQLRDVPWILPGPHSSITHALERAFIRLGLSPPACTTYSYNLSGLQLLVASGEGLGLIPGGPTGWPPGSPGSIVRVPIRDLPDAPVLHLVSVAGVSLTPAGAALERLLQEVA
jgi:LysR family transcriptional regulator, regulator of abg operon